MTPSKQLRMKNSEECKRYARAARAKCNVKCDAVANALHVDPSHADRMFSHEHYGFSYADLFLLARAPETAGMVRDMLAPLLELTDPRNLRLSDLEGMASSSTTAHTALQYLRPTFERLAPLMDVVTTGEVER